MSEKMLALPAMTLRGITVLPSMVVPFDISRDRSVKSLERSLSGDQILYLITQIDPQEDAPSMDGLYDIGCIARIKNVARLPHGLVRIVVEGIRRGSWITIRDLEDGSLEADVLVDDSREIVPEPDHTAMVRGLKDLFVIYAKTGSAVSDDVVRQILEIDDLHRLMEQVCANMKLDYTKRQQLLECGDDPKLFDTLTVLLAKEIEIERIRVQINKKVKERVDKSQKEYYLREQLKVITQELGEDLPMQEAQVWQEKVNALTAAEDIKERIRKEIRRFKSLSNNSSEASVSRTYIETLLDMPWDKAQSEHVDLKAAAAILDEDHYGLEKVKERILEYLAVRSLTRKGDSPILCLAGPPGTGKTSIARSIARALDKKYVRISLGGIRDEAEIRGHRRTYIGAMPGRIVAGLRNAGVKNPLMLLDEIDKLGTSYNGDPSSALLEVLDSEQNCRFSDHYIELPTDLSEVMFIATANDLHSVPGPLLDRMEVIEVSSYTENEKLHIAKEHLLKKQMEHHGIGPKQLSITDKALSDIISGYTREAGVRQLERRLGEICRKAARLLLEGEQEKERKKEKDKEQKKEQGKAREQDKTARGKDLRKESADMAAAVVGGKVRVKGNNLEKFLGKRLYVFRKRNEKNDVGIVCGLAWTAVGGVTLETEVNCMPGKGELVLTGQLGDVMKESARAAITYVRSAAVRYPIDPDFFTTHDIHVHIPEGAVPKDGPSAGITMATAILSASANLPVRRDVAMTGEITLRGRVLPIGGLKEKLLAARNARMQTVIVPEENRRDVEEISPEIIGDMEIVYARTMDTVLENALEKQGKA